MSQLTLETFREGLLNKDRAILSQAITLLESSLESDEKLSREILKSCEEKKFYSQIIGVSGAPGVGKSTFLDSFGTHLCQSKKTVAVLTIDPSSEVSGGSILGDKTRMNQLSVESNAYIRPSPSKGDLGGINRHTYQVSCLLEAFEFDFIFIETVGVGQSETLLAELCDYFLLLLGPAGGDDLQGIKKGIMEVVDLFVINKADGDFETKAKMKSNELKMALSILGRNSKNEKPNSCVVSALEKKGLKDCESFINEYFRTYTDKIKDRRKSQLRVSKQKLFLYQIEDVIKHSSVQKIFHQQSDEKLKEKLNQIEKIIKD